MYFTQIAPAELAQALGDRILVELPHRADEHEVLLGADGVLHDAHIPAPYSTYVKIHIDIYIVILHAHILYTL